MLAAACLGLAAWFLIGRGTDAESQEFLTATVWKGPYEFAVIEQGTLESASNTEIRSYVHSRAGSTTILNVVPEGTFVNEDDTVVELDTSNLLLDENAQQILVSTRESLLSEAQNTLKAARIAKIEYVEGLYLSQEKDLLSALFVADRAKATAESGLESAKVLHAKGIITALQVEAAHANLQDALNQFDAAQTKLSTLRNLTKQKELTLLEAALDSAEANVKSQQKSLGLEQDRLKEIQDQIAKCTIKAPAPGQVVYANESSMYYGNSYSPFIVAPGATVRERQTIIWLPNPDSMQVKATVNEARVTLIRPGLPVSIRVDALRDEMLEGEVIKVNPFAEPSFFSSGNIKKYATIIKLKNPPRELRVGMNAEVRIYVERMDDALQLPVQALAESKGHYFSLLKNGDDYETREVEISSTNDKVATIQKGLAEGDEVVMNPRSTGGLLKLPDLPDTSPFATSEPQRADVSEAPLGSPAASVTKQVGNDKEEVTNMTPAEVVAQFLENDTNHDDKLSTDEISKLETHLKQRLLTADTNGDGFLERRELLKVSANAVQPMREKRDRNKPTGSGEDSRPARAERGTPAG
jgi:RND family efflux transporter MFP subunit